MASHVSTSLERFELFVRGGWQWLAQIGEDVVGDSRGLTRYPRLTAATSKQEEHAQA